MQTRVRIKNLDLIRGISTLGIVLYHWSCSFYQHGITDTTGMYQIFYSLFGIDCGRIAVTMFFILSGGTLYYNYRPGIKDYKKFYKKRWLSIFPEFYLAFFAMFLFNIWKYKEIFYKGNPWTILYSVIGMDGYLLYRGDNYYILGEWFLGAIILLYLLFPLLLTLFDRWMLQSTAVILLLYGINLAVSLCKISDWNHPVTCLFAFWAGMLIMKYRDALSFRRIMPVLLLCIVMVLMQESLNRTVICQAVGITLYVILLKVPYNKENFIHRMIYQISRISYSIFLVHHVIINTIMPGFSGRQLHLFTSFLTLVIILMLTILAAFLLHLAGGKIRKSIEQNRRNTKGCD